MDKLFLRVYLQLLAAMLLFGLLFRLIIVPYADKRVTQNVEESFIPPVSLAAALLAEHYAAHHDFRVFQEIAARSSYPLMLIPEGSISLEPAQRERLLRGDVVRRGGPFAAELFVRIAGTQQILHLGPLPMVFPLASWRGPLALFLFICALFLGAFLLLRPIRRRITALGRAAVALGRGALTTRTEVGAADTIGALAQSFNSMAEEIQRLVTAREELLNMTSHELRTPIQRLHFSLENLRNLEDPERAPAACQRMEHDLLELDELIEEMLTYARLADRSPPLGSCELAPLCSKLCDSLSEMAEARSLDAPFYEPAQEALSITVEPRLVRRAVSNLLVNALRHARSRVELRLRREDARIHILVEDDGDGVPPADRERIFNPFFRRDDARTQNSRGSGLGLAIVRRIAEQHSGEVSVQDSTLGGACFRLSLPSTQAATL